MKRRFVLFLAVVTLLSSISCSLDEGNDPNFHFEALPVISADFPEFFEYGKIYRIDVVVERPSSCHFFETFDFNHTGETERTVFGIATVFEDDDCAEITDGTFETFFDFEVRYTNDYTFKLWSGKNENDEDEYLIVNVPVAQ